MNLLFITHANLTKHPYGDGSTRYRCFNVAEVALSSEHKAEVIELDRLRLQDLSRFDLISWLRPVPGRKAFDVINRAATLNIPCVADVDDLIFDPDLSAESPAVTNGFVSLKNVEKRFSAHARFLNYFNAITVSTTNLQAHVNRCFSEIPTATVHNGLSAYWLDHADQRHLTKPVVGKLGYLPGTRSHDQDLLSICDALAQWLKAMPEATLDIIGKIDVPEQKLPSTQVRRLPWMDYYQLPVTMAQHSATLSPLTRTNFNQAKSHIKFIESAALGIPLIAGPNDDLSAHRCAGLLFAETEAQWCDSLIQVSQSDYHASVSRELSQYARTYCVASYYAKPLIQAWEAGLLLPPSQTAIPFARAA